MSLFVNVLKQTVMNKIIDRRILFYHCMKQYNWSRNHRDRDAEDSSINISGNLPPDIRHGGPRIGHFWTEPVYIIKRISIKINRLNLLFRVYYLIKDSQTKTNPCFFLFLLSFLQSSFLWEYRLNKLFIIWNYLYKNNLFSCKEIK